MRVDPDGPYGLHVQKEKLRDDSKDQVIMFTASMFGHEAGDLAILQDNGFIRCGETCGGWSKNSEFGSGLFPMPKNSFVKGGPYPENYEILGPLNDIRRGDVVVIKNWANHGEIWGDIGVITSHKPGGFYNVRYMDDPDPERDFPLCSFELEVIDHDEDLLKEPEYHSQQMRDEMDEQGTVMSFNDVRPPSVDSVFDYYHPRNYFHNIYPEKLNRGQVEQKVLSTARSFFNGGPALLALDASGSTDIVKLKHQLLEYEGAIKDLRTVSFDTTVWDNGIYKSVVDSIQCPRGSTDIDCVLATARALGYKNVLMFSDGMFEIPDLMGIKIAVINPANQIAKIDPDLSWKGCVLSFDPEEEKVIAKVESLSGHQPDCMCPNCQAKRPGAFVAPDNVLIHKINGESVRITISPTRNKIIVECCHCNSIINETPIIKETR